MCGANFCKPHVTLLTYVLSCISPFFVMLIHANFLHRNQKILLLQLISDYSNFLKNLVYYDDDNKLYDLISRKKRLPSYHETKTQNSTKKQKVQQQKEFSNKSKKNSQNYICGQESRSTSSDFYAMKCIPETFNFPNAFNHWQS